MRQERESICMRVCVCVCVCLCVLVGGGDGRLGMGEWRAVMVKVASIQIRGD